MEQQLPKFKRRWRWIGKLVSEDGASIWYGYKSVYYKDQSGSFEFPFEDGILIPRPYQLEKERVPLTPLETDAMMERLAAGLRSDGTLFKSSKIAHRANRRSTIQPRTCYFADGKLSNCYLFRSCHRSEFAPVQRTK